MCVISTLYPPGIVSEHPLPRVLFTKAWFFQGWCGMKTDAAAAHLALQIWCIYCSQPHRQLLKRWFFPTDILLHFRVPRSFVSDGHHGFLKNILRHIKAVHGGKEGEEEKPLKESHKGTGQMAAVHHASSFLPSLLLPKASGAANSMHDHCKGRKVDRGKKKEVKKPCADKATREKWLKNPTVSRNT